MIRLTPSRRWLVASAIVLAFAAAALGLALTLTIATLVGPRAARTVGQIVAAVLGGAIFLGIGLGIAASGTVVPLLLDLGCNIGHLTTWYAACGAVRTVTGIDFVPQCIASARALAIPAGAADKFVDGDITQALPAGSFDAITDTHTISTLPDAAATLALVRSALQPAGIFVSVLAHATAASTAQFAHALAAAGLHVHKLEFVFGTDLGQTAAHPLLLAAIAQPATRVDIAGGFAAARLPGA